LDDVKVSLGVINTGDYYGEHLAFDTEENNGRMLFSVIALEETVIGFVPALELKHLLYGILALQPRTMDACNKEEIKCKDYEQKCKQEWEKMKQKELCNLFREQTTSKWYRREMMQLYTTRKYQIKGLQ
jgi:hypothetical protein